MTKKDIIEKIRKCNKNYRRLTNDNCESIFMNGVLFFYDSIKMCFDDASQALYIYDRNRQKIMAMLYYQTIRIDFDD